MDSKAFVHSILQKTDLSKPVITIYIVDHGDPSRYHEMVVLEYWKSKWILTEDYLTPEYKFHRESFIANITSDTVHIWLDQLVTKNIDVILNGKKCPQEGLLLP